MKIRKWSIVKLIMPIFVLVMMLTLWVYNMSPMHYLSLTLNRVGMLLIATLAIIPTMYSGVGINFGVSIGFVCGLGGAVFGIMTGNTGLALMLCCIAFSVPLATVSGYGYSKLLNAVKGSETLIATYAGFAFVALASICWILINVDNEILKFSNGEGIRVQVNLEGLFKDVLTNFLPITIGALTIPAGFFLVCFIICVLFWIFSKSKTGISMQICGKNPDYARSIGLNVNNLRMLSVIISTILAAVGISFYAQTYGYYQFYNTYMNLGFTCVAGVLVGGGTDKKVTMFNVIYGCIMYEAILTMSTPVANRILPSGALPEIIRIFVTNGIILYALVKGGNDSNGR